MPDEDFKQLTSAFLKGSPDQVVDAPTFVEAKWGLNEKLLPAQKFILKCYYSLSLDDTEKNIVVPDITHEKILYTFTEQEFLHWLYEEGRCNTNEIEGKTFRELVWVAGRRSGKCRAIDDRIATTKGSITFGELANRKRNGEKIGILTYGRRDLRKKVVFEFDVWNNQKTECFELETKRGIREISSWNHPYLVWRDNWEMPKWVPLKDIKIGDFLATAASTDLFGNESIGEKKAALLGYFQGDGGTTLTVSYTTDCPKKLQDFSQLIGDEFPGYIVEKQGKASWRYGYRVVKSSRRFLQDGSQKNLAKEWLMSVGCFGKKSINKEVPDCIFRGSKKEVAAFISRLFACDGYAHVSKQRQKNHGGMVSYVGYCSASRKMVDGVRHLLLKFGIHPSVTLKRPKCNGKTFLAWILTINRLSDLEIFVREIGIFSKEDAVNRVIANARARSEPKGLFDSLPRGIWGYIERVRREKGLSCADVTGEHGHCTSHRLRNYYAPHRRKVAVYGKNIDDRFLMQISNSDVRWDIVREIKKVGIRETIDVSVPETHIIGGDIISHNSTIASYISSYEIYKLVKRGNPSAYYGFPPNSEFAIVNVAPTDDEAAVIYNMISSKALRCKFLFNRCLHQTMTYFDMMTDEDMASKMKKKRASIVSIAGGCSANAIRGHNTIVVIMDEFAFFIDNNGRFSGGEVYSALTPSTASFKLDGKIISISSPYAKYGKFYERYQRSFDEPQMTLMFKMYSALANPTIPTEILRADYRKDKAAFMREFGGEFSENITAWIEDENELYACVDKDIKPTKKGKPGIYYYAGLDLGLKNDGTALSIVHKEGEQFILDYSSLWFSSSSDVWDQGTKIYANCRFTKEQELLQMTDIVKELAELARWFNIRRGIFDQHQGYGLMELLIQIGLKQFEMINFTDKNNSDMYDLVRSLMLNKLLVLYEHEVLIPELLTLEAEKKTKQKTEVRAPNKAGAHDDISESYVRAVWACHEATKGQITEHTTMMVGAGSTITPATAKKLTPMKSYQLQKQKMHGDHPRLPVIGKRGFGNAFSSMLGKRRG